MNYITMLSKFFKFVKSISIVSIKENIKKYQIDIILCVGVMLISLLSFAIGFITAKQQEKQPLQFQTTGQAAITEQFTH